MYRSKSPASFSIHHSSVFTGSLKKCISSYFTLFYLYFFVCEIWTKWLIFFICGSFSESKLLTARPPRGWFDLLLVSHHLRRQPQTTILALDQQLRVPLALLKKKNLLLLLPSQLLAYRLLHPVAHLTKKRVVLQSPVLLLAKLYRPRHIVVLRAKKKCRRSPVLLLPHRLHHPVTLLKTKNRFLQQYRFLQTVISWAPLVARLWTTCSRGKGLFAWHTNY